MASDESGAMKERKPTTFRLIDLIVVASIILICLTWIPPAVLKREALDHLRCRSNIRQIGVGLGAHDAQLGCLPRPAGTEGADGLSVIDQLRPFMDADTWAKGAKPNVLGLRCPSDESFVAAMGGMSYGVNIRGWNGFGKSDEKFTKIEDISAGAAYVVAAGDLAQAGHYVWSLPNSQPGSLEGEYNGYYGAKLTETTRTGSDAAVIAQDGSGSKAPLFSSFHPDGIVNLLLFDGHVVASRSQGAIGMGQDGKPSGTGIIGACHPGYGNRGGEW
jgi:prepilin-type processing-associated H-X9-DG protein